MKTSSRITCCCRITEGGEEGRGRGGGSEKRWQKDYDDDRWWWWMRVIIVMAKIYILQPRFLGRGEVWSNRALRMFNNNVKRVIFKRCNVHWGINNNGQELSSCRPNFEKELFFNFQPREQKSDATDKVRVPGALQPLAKTITRWEEFIWTSWRTLSCNERSIQL